ncbi:MAG: diphosphomevalonate decarboxylase, partial [Kiritimatiellae bacterium]|nr:diphosphomevalonate decarboxylase [Kiritimatiellia bacterium]
MNRARAAALAALGERWDGAAREGAEGEGWASANVALVKYWGKRDEELKLPVAGSLSGSLGGLGTRTRVRVLG